MASQFLNDEWGWNGWFLLTAALLTLNGIVLTLVLDRYTVESNTSLGVAGLLKKLPAMLVESQLRWLYLATLTVMCGFVGITTAMQLVGPAGLDSDPSRLLLLRAATLPVCVAVPLTSRLLGSISAKRRVAVAMASGAVALAALSLNFGLVWVGICLAALTCAVAVTAPALIEAIGVAGARARGVATALYGFAMFAGASVGPLIATQLAHIGFTTIAYALASLMAIGTLCAAKGLSSKPTSVNSSS
ncbi:hypothetical protein QMK17_16280 [Rhodococcus sp. G-MC3]|uniref:hypothetical protein n=1 Tax=Rhodococcus sp. G-MC3 TaxID=3046209 RepID=UPI0024B930A9|nr:hypothetical protein [Rhodococcus sp. G-MC3]MDJ0394883.1 hypothetical protein [Rhodococcus sp. G-MC3]